MQFNNELLVCRMRWDIINMSLLSDSQSVQQSLKNCSTKVSLHLVQKLQRKSKLLEKLFHLLFFETLWLGVMLLHTVTITYWPELLTNYPGSSCFKLIPFLKLSINEFEKLLWMWPDLILVEHVLCH
mmetsp:Transcript_38515/g.49749  ORF Transcript_38515/g.49749 Transcript_38515/m.49749 type:complete len:127 (-) Transcript_38515:2495-2875(-)